MIANQQETADLQPAQQLVLHANHEDNPIMIMIMGIQAINERSPYKQKIIFSSSDTGIKNNAIYYLGREAAY